MFSRRTNWDLTANAYTRAVESHKRSGRELLDLTASNPTTIGLEYDPTLLQAFTSPQSLQYSPEPRGLEVARQAVVHYYRDRGDIVDANHVILTTSTSEAYSFVFRLLCDADDEILISSPSYPLFDFLADLHDVRLKPYSLFYDHGWHVDMHSLRTALSGRTRAIMAVHPNNPTGSFLQANEIAELNAISRERNLALVIDEVFLDFPHDLVHHPSFAANSAALTFTLSGLSKISGLPQMKFAWIAVSGPDSLVADALSRLEVIADTYLSMNAPTQLAAPALFQQRHSFQRQLSARIEANLSDLDVQLAKQRLCERLAIEGGWYATLRVPVTRSDEELAIVLLEQCDVLVQPGHFYDFPSSGYLILSLITPEPTFREGLTRILQFLSS
jgi:aspartate/methionine/tyrosine aminotransferase